MLGDMLRLTSACALLLGGACAAHAADLDTGPEPAYERYEEDGNYQPPVHKVHSVDHAYRKLERYGFYNIVVERTDAPYSFQGCKRGVRYHIHISYQGELEELNKLGSCHNYANSYGGDGYYGRRRHYEGRYDDENWRRWTYRRARHYY